MAGADLKACTCCKQTKPLSAFHKNKGRPFGVCCWCKECTLAARKLIRRENPELARQRDRQKRLSDPEGIKRRSKQFRATHVALLAKRAKEYHEANRAYLLEKMRQRKAANPLRNRTHQNQRRARKAGLPDTFTVGDAATALRYWDHRCAACSVPFGLYAVPHFDHWVPLSHPKCPGTTPDNMIPLCRNCNQTKHKIDPNVWLERRFGERATAIARLIDLFFANRRRKVNVQ